MLQIRNVRASHGRMPVLEDISIEVGRGEIVGVIGPNGAGKSTLMNVVIGGLRPDQGEISLNGQAIQGLRPDRIARRGLTLVPEGRHVFSTLSVYENLLIGGYMGKSGASGIARVIEYFPRLAERLRLPAGKLSGGEQQMLVIGRALLTNPRLMMIDEPSLGLAPRIVDEVYSILHRLREQEGLTLLINEQSANRLLRFADRAYVLREGKVRLHGKASDLRTSDELTASYFGRESREREDVAT